jgi:hypothetical protein
MEDAIDLSVPMVAGIGSSANWMEAKSSELWSRKKLSI